MECSLFSGGGFKLAIEAKQSQPCDHNIPPDIVNGLCFDHLLFIQSNIIIVQSSLQYYLLHFRLSDGEAMMQLSTWMETGPGSKRWLMLIAALLGKIDAENAF